MQEENSTDSSLNFSPSDFEFLPLSAQRDEVIKNLAGLELRKHRLRLELVVANGDGTRLIAPNVTIADELGEVEAAISRVRGKFAELIYANENVSQQ